MEAWKPREHDALVEPMFAGLGAGRADAPESPAASRRLAVALAIVAGLIALRALLLFLR